MREANRSEYTRLILRTFKLINSTMNPKCFKYCSVPKCKNNTIKTPDKLFIHVPSDKAIRRKWIDLANFTRTYSVNHAAGKKGKSRKCFCEDHFDLPKDMVNYMQYRIMGAVGKISMRDGCLPSKFECQRQTTSHTTEQPALKKKTSQKCNKLVKNETVADPSDNLSMDDPSTTSARKGRKSYRCCMVPQCINTTVTAPGKMFIRVPDNMKMRLKWLELARRKATLISSTTSLHCCEDHFDLPNDMQNYMRYKLMGYVKTIRMVPGCVPSRFDCQPDRRKRFSYKTTRPLALKRERAELIKEAESSIQKSDSSPADEMERDYSASDTDSCDSMEVHVKIERDSASETDICSEAFEFVRVKEENCFEPEINIEVEIGPEMLQPQDIYYNLNDQNENRENLQAGTF